MSFSHLRLAPITRRCKSSTSRAIRNEFKCLKLSNCGDSVRNWDANKCRRLFGSRPSFHKNAGLLGKKEDEDDDLSRFIPQTPVNIVESTRKKRILVLCSGGTLTMSPGKNGALTPVPGALTNFMSSMIELQDHDMPETIIHEYEPLLDSSDMGPPEWAVLAKDIATNYHFFDGFVVVMGTDTMAYTATALSFMLENLCKPVVFTGSQIPFSHPYNDARHNLIMALIFASRNSINEVSIFFHDRLLRGCRATKTSAHRLLAFDSPNLEPLAKIGISIDENASLALPQARGSLRSHTNMETRIVSLRLVPGFDDGMIEHMIHSALESSLKALVLQLYGTGNMPKTTITQSLREATDNGMLVVAGTQCHSGSVLMGHYEAGVDLKEAGVVSAADMTLEAITCKLGYLLGRGDLTSNEVSELIGVSLRGEITPVEALPPPPLSTAFQRASRKGKKFY